MAEFDVEAVILETVRRQSGHGDARPSSRFAEDLKMSENGRKALFAFMTEAFTARGVNLPSRGFYQSDFLACRTPAEVHAAVRDAMAGVRKKSAAPGAGQKGKGTTAKPAATGAPAAPVAAPARAGGSAGSPTPAGGPKSKQKGSKDGAPQKEPKRGKRR